MIMRLKLSTILNAIDASLDDDDDRNDENGNDWDALCIHNLLAC